ALRMVTLQLARSGAGSVMLSETPAGIKCGTVCLHDALPISTVTLTAAAAGNSTFQGWGGACTGTGVCTVRLAADTVVTASFALRPPPRPTLPQQRRGHGGRTVMASETPPGINCGTDCMEAYP